MSDLGIKAYAVYVPRLRMDRASIAAAHAWAMPGLRSAGRGERAFCSWDEDTITMSVDAVRSCLRSPVDAAVRSLTFASTTPVFSDLQNSSLVAGAAGLPNEITTQDSGGSLRAGTTALIRALESSGAGDAIVVGADNRRTKPASMAEMQYGAGSCALRVGSGDVIARFLGSASGVSQFVDHFRAAGEPYDYHWEERWIRDEGYLKIVPATVSRLLKSSGVKPEDIDFFCLPATIGGVAAAVAKLLKLRPEAVVDNLAARCGDTGAAHPFMMLAVALESAKPGQKIMVVGFGEGCDALLFEATPLSASYASPLPVSAALARGVTEKAYNKFLSFSGELELDWGMRSETDNKTAQTQLYRSRDMVIGFAGGQCSDCGAVQFPRMPQCVKCSSVRDMVPVRLADLPARVQTYTADSLMYYPAPPLYVGLVQFDNGARLVMEMVDVNPAQFDVGTQLRMVFRVKEKDSLRHNNRYFWKATPLG
jgi:3-hydroxy-3-methylglutaryl CoA synthase